jgi:hypothetical protein
MQNKTDHRLTDEQTFALSHCLHTAADWYDREADDYEAPPLYSDIIEAFRRQAVEARDLAALIDSSKYVKLGELDG